uniref:Inner centromere protein ARK-binding domain-containing protein n=1 Tax=Eptatretus burgeri TaxID=7764 RepID=A0A8C4QSA1_EPTBU
MIMMPQLENGVLELLGATQGKVNDLLWKTVRKESTNFVESVESNHFAWLEEIVLEAMRCFSSEMPQLLPMTPSVKNRHKQKRAVLPKESRRSSRVVRRSLARQTLFQSPSLSTLKEFRRVTRAGAMKKAPTPLAAVATKNDNMDVERSSKVDNDWMDVDECVKENVNERQSKKGSHLPLSKFHNLKNSAQHKDQSKVTWQAENEAPASTNIGKAFVIASKQADTVQKKILTRCGETQGSYEKKSGRSHSARSARSATQKPLPKQSAVLRSASAIPIRKIAVAASGRQKQMNDGENWQSCSEEEFISKRTRTQRERTPIDGDGPQNCKAFPPQKTATNLLDSGKANLKTQRKNLAPSLQRTPPSVSPAASRATLPRRLNKDNRKVLMEQLLKKQQMDEERKKKAEEEKSKKLDEMRKKREERLRKAREKAVLNEQEKKRRLEERAQERKQAKTQGNLRTPTAALRSDTRVCNAHPDTDDDDGVLISKREEEPKTVADLMKKFSKNLESYEMTPCSVTPKPLRFCDEDDYGLDIVSDDSTDDEDCPRKPVPKWATGRALHLAITKQYFHPIDFDELFKEMMIDIRLEVVFTKFKPCFDKRTSSANWNSPPRKLNLSDV